MSKYKQGAVGIDMVNVSRFRGLQVKSKQNATFWKNYLLRQKLNTTLVLRTFYNR